MCNYKSVITKENLKFATVRPEGGIPSLYFIDSNGCFVRIRPFHESGFATVKRENRTIFFLTDKEYKATSHSTGALLEANAPKGSRYNGKLRESGSALRVVDFSDNTKKPHKGHYLTPVEEVRQIYRELGIDLEAFIAYCGGGDNDLEGVSKENILKILKARFPVK